ncbi:hypothetical protein HY745_10230 [Candidatus Desantisbacteria bacterium]|nr:hypothetical protein [Candidatus Desantisbacteria bacterium]
MTKKNVLIFCVLFLLFCITAQAGTFTIPDWLINSCVFIMRGEEVNGTGFLIWIKEYDSNFCYLVTAKHVAQSVLSNTQDPLKIRFNLKEGNNAKIFDFPTFNFKGKRWIEHENPTIDIAVIPLTIFDKVSKLEVGVRIIESPEDEFLATTQWINKYKVAPGDQAFSLGLVPYLYAKDQKNLVLSRFGTISLLLDQEINLPGGKQKAYFLDCQAFPGNSGGPAFVLIERSEEGPLLSGWRFGLLGVVAEFVPSALRTNIVDIQDTQHQTTIQLIEH